MIQIVNPRTGRAYDCEVLVTTERFAEVLVKSEGRTVRVDYDHLQWASPDWYVR